MAKYGFDYYIQRTNLLSEMARPWTPMNELGEPGTIAKQIFDQIATKMGEGGELNGLYVPGLAPNKRKNRVLRYFIFMMSKMNEISEEEDVSDLEASEEIVGKAAEILGIPKQGWRKVYDDPDKLYRAAIVKGVGGPYKDYVTSPEFRQTTLSMNNILEYILHNRVTNPFSQAVAKKEEEYHGKPIEDIDKAQMEIRPLVTKIHKAMAAKRKRKTPQEPVGTQSENDVSNEYVDNLYLVLDALEILIDNSQTIKNMVDSTLSKFSIKDEETLMSIIEDIHDKHPDKSVDYIKSLYEGNPKIYETLYNAYSQLKDTGINLDDFYKKLEIFKSKNSPSIQKMIDMLVFEIQELQKTIGLVTQQDPEESKEEFPGYDQDIIDSILQTPENKSKFGNYYQWLKIEMQRNLEKIQQKIDASQWGEAELPNERELVRKGFEQFKAKRPEMRKAENAEVKEVEKKLKSAPMGESYVMDYMEEQVQKDRFKPKGEFKDRGFKKMNYLQWLEKNS